MSIVNLAMDNYKRLKNKIEADAKKHGGIKDTCVTFNEQCDNVDDLIQYILIAGINILKGKKAGIHCNKIMLKTSKELNNKLKDIPENQGTWDKIYKEVPPCFMARTMRIESQEDDNCYLQVFTDLNSVEGKKMANLICKNLGL